VKTDSSILHTKLYLYPDYRKNYILEELLIDFQETLEPGNQGSRGFDSRYESHLFKYRQQNKKFRKRCTYGYSSWTDQLGSCFFNTMVPLHAYDLKEVEWIY
jgi:hypothetical protein